MKKLTLALASTFTVLGASAFAGSATFEPPVEAPVVAPVAVAAPVSTGGNWTGAYAGVQLGYGDVDTSGAASETGDGLLYGVHAGYNHDFGTFVLGGELDYDFADISLSGAGGDIDNVARAKLKAGYDMGSALVYLTGGYAAADASLGSDNGTFLGAGVDYKVSPDWTVGGEYLAHQFDDFDSTGIDLDVNTFKIKASYNF